MLQIAVPEVCERPILFSGPMVPPVLADTKTQTRRAAKFVALELGLNFDFTGLRAAQDRPGGWTLQSRDGATNLNDRTKVLRCPYGVPGDRLWVRETFYAFGRWITAYDAKKDRDAWHFIDMTLECGKTYSYADTDSNPVPMRGRRDGGITPGWWKRPAIFMPRAASRILLEVTEVRVERLQDISEADAMAEGITCDNVIVGAYYANGHHEVTADRYFFEGGSEEGYEHASEAYAALWDHINGAGEWEKNPWVWAVSFRRITP